MRKILIIFIILLFISCSPLQKVKFYHPNDKVRLKINVPKGYDLEHTMGSHEEELVYTYPDSSIVYLSTFEGGSWTCQQKQGSKLRE